MWWRRADVVSDRSGSLVLVPTPIGNLGDITLRAIEVLRRAHHIVAEDTRRSRKLLAHLGLDATRLSRLDAHCRDVDLERVLTWVKEGQDVAAMTDAGSPGVSDPGAALVRAAAASDLRVIALPGASAVTAAVAVSGLVDSAFRFFGFLARTRHDRARAIAAIATSTEPCVLFEAPTRTARLLAELADAMPTRSVVIAREISKLHEEIVRGLLSEVAATHREWIGEITLVLGAWDPQRSDAPGPEQIDTRIDAELVAGVHTRTVAERVAAWSGRPRREIYERVLERNRQKKDSATVNERAENVPRR